MLHKASKIHGFHLFATDGEIGHIEDVLINEDWTVPYLVVDTSNWIGGRSVLIPASAIEGVNSPEKKVRVNLSRDQIKHSPSVETADIELIETLPPVIM